MPEYGINGTTLNLEHIQLKCFNAADWPANQPADDQGHQL